jgi:hypothetical protein
MSSSNCAIGSANARLSAACDSPVEFGARFAVVGMANTVEPGFIHCIGFPNAAETLPVQQIPTETNDGYAN